MNWIEFIGQILNRKHFLFVQIIVATIKNLIVLNKSLFDGFSTIVIPALSGIANHQNPNETIRITPVESSWLCNFEDP